MSLAYFAFDYFGLGTPQPGQGGKYLPPGATVPGIYWSGSYWYNRFYQRRFWPGTPAAVNSNLGSILTSIKGQLVASMGLNANQVAISLWREQFPTAGDLYLRVAPGRQVAVSGGHDGGGRYTSEMDGTVYVRVYRRTNMDMQYVDDVRVADPSYGVLAAVHGVHEALEMFFPVDANAANLTMEPMRITGIGEPLPNPQNQSGQVMIETSWNVRYFEQLTVNVLQ